MPRYFLRPFVIALARRLTIKSICGTSFCAGRCLGYHAFDILHMSDRRKDLEVIRKKPVLCAQFIDMCSFITPQIKFGNPASAVMYYKAQMGGRKRWGGRK